MISSGALFLRFSPPCFLIFPSRRRLQRSRCVPWWSETPCWSWRRRPLRLTHCGSSGRKHYLSDCILMSNRPHKLETHRLSRRLMLFCFKGIFTDILTLFMWRKVRIMEVRTIEPAQCRYLNTAGVMEPTYFTSSSWKFLHSHRTEFILLLVRCDWLNRLKSFWATLRKNKRE